MGRRWENGHGGGERWETSFLQNAFSKRGSFPAAFLKVIY